MDERLSDSHVEVADGLRVIFIFLIGWYHIWQQSWLGPYLHIGNFTLNLDPLVRTGYIWVDGMLLLSGFLSFLPCARAMRDGAPLPRARDFYRRRAARILPSYLFCVLLLFFCVALPQGAYPSPKYMWQDLLSHLTFTHTFFSYSYFSTQLNVVLWTLAVEVQFYLIFPLLARAFARKPLVTWLGMVAAAFIYRGWVDLNVADTNIWINQLIAFMDIYALGFLCAWVYVGLAREVRPSKELAIVCTALSVVLCFVLWRLIMRQVNTSGYEELRRMQMRNRFALGAVLSLLLLCLSFSARGLRRLLSGRAARFLSGISFQFYIWHQYLAVRLKEWHIPPSAYEVPNQAGDKPWQWLYTLLCFALALIVATLVTYLIERPCARRLRPKPRPVLQDPNDYAE